MGSKKRSLKEASCFLALSVSDCKSPVARDTSSWDVSASGITIPVLSSAEGLEGGGVDLLGTNSTSHLGLIHFHSSTAVDSDASVCGQVCHFSHDRLNTSPFFHLCLAPPFLSLSTSKGSKIVLPCVRSVFTVSVKKRKCSINLNKTVSFCQHHRRTGSHTC